MTWPIYEFWPAVTNLYKIKKGANMLGTILIILVILMLLGSIPTWPHSREWGYYPSSGLGIILLIIIFLYLTGRL